jgi:hypothetical protein
MMTGKTFELCQGDLGTEVAAIENSEDLEEDEFARVHLTAL